MRPAVFLCLALSAAGLSGCYLDHRPHPTVEDRFYADEATRRELDGVKVRQPSLAEYDALTDSRPDAVAFDLKLDDSPYRIVLLGKSSRATFPKPAVFMLTGSEWATPRSFSRKASLAFLFEGIRFKAAVVDEGRAVSPRIDPPYVYDRTDVCQEDPSVVGKNLSPVAGAVRRFVVRRFIFKNAAGAVDSTLEIECLIVPESSTVAESELRKVVADQPE